MDNTNQPANQNPPSSSGTSPATPPAQTPAASSPTPPPPAPSTPPASPTPPPTQPGATPTPPASPTDSASSSTQPPKASGKNPFRLLFLFLLAIVIAGGAFAYWWYTSSSDMQKKQQAQSSQNAPTSAAKPLLVGTDPTYEPMEFKDKDNKIVGYDIDLITIVADELKKELVIKETNFDDIFNKLDAREYDMIISAVTITEERAKKYDFSEPYINAGEVFVMQKKAGQETTPLVTKTDMKGKKIGAQKGTQMVVEAKKVTSPSLVIEYESNDPAIADLKIGKIDALLTDLPNAKGVVSANPTLKIASDPITDEYFAIAFRKGDPLKNDVNTVLSSLKQNGILTDLRKKWLE